ncbi:helix-turn-helix domain-containing protein [Micrococcaceae sp. AOP34-BR2-30]
MTIINEDHRTRTTSQVVGGEVRAWMARLGIRQKDLAELLGVAQPRVSARLRGDVTFDIEELVLIAQHFGVSLGELLGSSLVNEKGPRPAVRDEGLGELPRLDSNQQPFD